MTACQFAIQNVLCRIVLNLGIVQRSANAVELDWHQYFRQGKVGTCKCQFCRVLPQIKSCNVVHQDWENNMMSTAVHHVPQQGVCVF